jgi:RNA polymerase sigma-70 factor (ECF subfamily)
MRARRAPRRGASPEALEQVYRDRFRDLVRTAQAIVGDASLAQDVVHDAFVAAIRRREQFRGDGPVEAWIWRAVVNQALDQLRRRTVVPLDDRLPAAGAAAELDRRQVRSAVSGLPERQRLVLFLRYFGDLDYAAIADVLQIRPGTVSATLSAAHESLRSRLAPTRMEVRHEQTRRAL